MNLLQTASGQSCFRGYNYYTMGKVKNYEQLDATHYQGTVAGSQGKNYNVTIDLAHPKKSQCTCPHVKDRQIVCKHMVALYFTIFPDEATQFITEVERQQAETESYYEEIDEQIEHYVRHLKKAELQNILLTLLADGPDWQYEKFIREHLGIF
ncbi:MAG: SWIM zinc finger family protein [Peptococcaceae bacterium]|nr:SWIM zinc finger family protein [Peptococcaceae bacterium]